MTEPRPDLGEAQAPPPTLRVQVVYALPETCWSAWLEMPTGSTVGEAIDRAALHERDPRVAIDRSCLANFGKPIQESALLRHGDRIELLRPLVTDPMERRRARARAGSGKPR